MSDRHETIADIIAEMRQGMNPSGTAECQYLESDICMLADRFEAAHRRERGNAAKLREAVAKCVNLITEFGNAEIVKTPLDVIVDIEAILKATLAAPPRNCDRPECATTKAAQDVWRREDGGKTAYYEWLLATAKEGGDK